MESEEVLDHSTRAAILSKLVGKQKEAAAQQLSPSVQNVSIIKAAAAPIQSTEKLLCKNCNHKIWNDGEEWQHGGREHDANCDCRKPEPKTGEGNIIGGNQNNKFDSTTPAAELLEAVIQNKVGEMKKEEQEAAILDKNRQLIIEKVNERSTSILKGWRF